MCKSSPLNDIYIYLSAVELTPGGSSTSHIYTQTVHTHNTEKGKIGTLYDIVPTEV
jgi:hypothetical protein